MANVSFQHVKKLYSDDGRYAVDDFHLEVSEGEFIVLVGPSGCGKSTLLRMLAGLENISEGEIYIGDRMINYVPSKDRNIAMVFQNYALYPHMSVFENIAFGLRLRKMAKHEIHERVTRAAKVLEIESMLDRLPKQMSGGQRQRVALGRAMVREPQVFLMDEPLSNLDAKLRVQMREEITKLHRKLKATMIFVTHDQIEAMTMGTRIVVMRGGIIQQVGAPREIYLSPRNMFVAGFIGSPPMNFIKGAIKVHADGVHFETRRYSLLIPENKSKQLRDKFSGKEIVLGVRAEKINCKLPQEEDLPDSNSRFDAVVEMIEFMGSDTFVHLNNSQHKIVVRVDPLQFQTEEGTKLNVEIDMNAVHFFDPETEEALC